MDWSWAQHPVVLAVVGGVLSAASVDYAAFRKWQSFDDAKSYAWSLAAWRWFQGGVIGLVTGLGLTALIGQ